MTIDNKGLFGTFASIVSARNRQLDDTPDILVESPLLDSQLLKLEIEKDPKQFVSKNRRDRCPQCGGTNINESNTHCFGCEGDRF